MSEQIEDTDFYRHIVRNQNGGHLCRGLGSAALALGVGVGIAGLSNVNKMEASLVSLDAGAFGIAGMAFSYARTYDNRANVLLAEQLARERATPSPTDIPTQPES